MSELIAADVRDGEAAEVDEYRIASGDELDIRFFYAPELNLVLPVRPDGGISLPYVREVQAAGKSPRELGEELRERYAPELNDPEVSVIVLTFSANVVHVGGHVDGPGVFPLTPAMTVLESVSQAGGLLPEARLSEVLVVRHQSEGPRRVYRVDLLAALDGTDVRQDIPLQPCDIVYVPSSPIAQVNKWVDQYIRLNLPINFTYRLNK